MEIPAFIRYLDEVWENRLLFSSEINLLREGFEPSKKQPFFSFTHDRKIKAKNYVGFTHWNNHRIEVLPKVMQDNNSTTLWSHLTHWLSYCRKINFPFTDFETSFKSIDSFPEALIYTFATSTRDILKSSPFKRYEEVVEVSQVMKGSLNFNRYINEQFTKGNPHKLVVEHEPLLHDNLLNQIVKFVSSQLQHSCRFTDTFNVLQEILFLLDEVSEIRAIPSDCDRVSLNKMFIEYQRVLDMCKFFLAEGFINNDGGSYQNFSFLLPMEYVFEDYLAGFIESHFADQFSAQYQARDWLTDQNVFQIQNDLLLINKKSGVKIIIDTKYKKRYRDESHKKGIAQNDLYQMIAYAVRRKCNTILLIYPQHTKDAVSIDNFTISSEMFKNGPIKIFAADVPFVYDDISGSEELLKMRIKEIFEQISKGLYIKP